jgi:tRNA-Thr(GGU) m(6)t(6)A37 methyltransferase TsaA
LTDIRFKPIGRIRTPFKKAAGMPIQPCGARGQAGWAELDPEYQAGLLDLEGFSHIILLYYFHRAEGFRLMVTPFLDDRPHGVFATRAPKRPNPIGLSVVRLTRVEGRIIHVLDVDMLDGTPLLDIKPFVPQFDSAAGEPEDLRLGWLADRIEAANGRKSDQRFD